MRPRSRTRAQSSFEFIVIVGILFMILIGAMGFIQGKIYTIAKDRNDALLSSVANMIRIELAIAESVDGEYSREFIIPFVLEGNNYSVTMESSADALLKMDDSEHLLLLSENMTGFLKKGSNIIRKMDGQIIVNYQCRLGFPGVECDQSSMCDDGNPWTIDVCTPLCRCENQSLPSCGNFVLDPPEMCEPANTYNNTNCSQSTSTCMGNMTGTRDAYGDCEVTCACGYDQFDYACMYGSCGADCESDAICEDGDPMTIDACEGCVCTQLFEWIITGNVELFGVYDRINNLVIAPGANVSVRKYNGSANTGFLEIHARNITVMGLINASGKGYDGGNGGAGGNGGDSDGSPTVSSGFSGVNGSGPFGGAGGFRGLFTNVDGLPGWNGTKGGYAAPQSQGDISEDETVFMGSGGGGGGGGAGGAVYIDYGATPGSGGGGGGAGAAGGGYVKLYASQIINITGMIYTTGENRSGNGSRGDDSGSGDDQYGAGGLGGFNSTLSSMVGGMYGASLHYHGGVGGRGEAGAGGGLLLKANEVYFNSSSSDARGGGANVINGGTVKIFYKNVLVNSTFNAGRVFIKKER
ncbi:hypothetical protein JW826_01305 [Candidatus Woesearchaeota archaeon]|nr:hypothetical protein [Candidatus Woesearchaeota archaeon]